MLLVKRANGTSKSILPETSILGIIYEAISKDPREEIKIMSTYSSWNNQSLEELMLTLHKSPHAGPLHTRNVKMNETTSTAYCNRFKVRKYTFGECCKFKHEINPEFKHRESVLVEKKLRKIRRNYLIQILKEFLILIITTIVLLVNRVVTMRLNNLRNTPMNKL